MVAEAKEVEEEGLVSTGLVSTGGERENSRENSRFFRYAAHVMPHDSIPTL